MQDLQFVVNHYPEGLTFSIPTIGPLELRDQMELNLQDTTSDWLAFDVDVEVWQVAGEFVELILVIDR